MELAESLGLGFVDLERVRFEAGIESLVPAGVARLYHVVPLRTKGRTLFVATAHPKDADMTADLRKHSDREIILIVALADEIAKVLNRFYPEEPLR